MVVIRTPTIFNPDVNRRVVPLLVTSLHFVKHLFLSSFLPFSVDPANNLFFFSHQLPCSFSPPPTLSKGATSQTGTRKERMASVLDYSKWDNLTVSSDEEDDDFHDRSTWQPTVHRLEKPTSVTFGGANVTVPSQDSVPAAALLTNKTNQTKTTTSPTASTASTPVVNSWTTNGASTETHVWSQSRSEVTVRVYIPSAVGGKNIQISTPDERTLSIQIVNRTDDIPQLAPLIVTGKLSFPIVTVPDMLDIDWEIERSGSGTCSQKEASTGPSSCVVRVTVLKKVVSSQLIVWWNRMYAAEPAQLDVANIEGRKNGGAKGMNKAQSVWAEAHQMFKQKIAEKKKQNKIAVEINAVEQ